MGNLWKNQQKTTSLNNKQKQTNNALLQILKKIRHCTNKQENNNNKNMQLDYDKLRHIQTQSIHAKSRHKHT